MKTSEFTDKKVTELSRSHSDDFSDQEDDSDSSFRFRPRRFVVSSHFQNRSSTANMDHTRIGSAKPGTSNDGELISVIDCRMEEYSKNLLHAMEGLCVRLCQLETRTRKIEDSVNELKDSSVFNHGRTEQKLKDLENVLTEVQVGIRDLRDKQEISEVQIKMAKLKILKSRQQSEDQKTKNSSSSDQVVQSTVQPQSNQSHPTHNVPSQQHYPTHTSIHQTPSYQNPPPPMPTASQTQTQTQFPSISSPILSLEYTHQQHSMPPIQPPQPTYPTAYQPYRPVQLQQPALLYPSVSVSNPFHHSSPVPQLPLTSQSSHPMPLPRPPRDALDPQVHRFPTQNFGGFPYMPPQTYNPSIHNTYSAPGLAPPSQQVNFGSRSSEIHHEHTQPIRHSRFCDDYARYGFPSNYSGPNLSSSEVQPFSLDLGSDDRFSRSSKPRELPRALPMASEVDSGSGSSRTENNVSVDDVVDNVVAMGFRRDLVRATVKKMTENGQSVDLNVVLDKLMNGGGAKNER